MIRCAFACGRDGSDSEGERERSAAELCEWQLQLVIFGIDETGFTQLALAGGGIRPIDRHIACCESQSESARLRLSQVLSCIGCVAAA